MAFKKWDARPAKERDALAPVVNAATSFTVDLVGRLGRQRENRSLAPWSLWSALTTVAGGATGQTRMELRRLLHLAVTDEVLRSQWKTLQGRYARALRSAGLTLRDASALWVKKGLTLKPAAAKGQLGVGHAAVQRADCGADPEQAQVAMNRWPRGRGRAAQTWWGAACCTWT